MVNEDKATLKKEDQEPLCVRKRKCLAEMKEIITLIGPWSINKAALSRKYGVKWQSIDAWFTNLLKGINPEQICNVKVMGDVAIKRSMAICERILADPNSKIRDRLDAIDKTNQTLKHYTEFLEAYNLKSKVADQISVSGNLDIGKLMAIAQEAKQRRETNNANKKDTTEGPDTKPIQPQSHI